MTKVKMCGITREEDIAVINELMPAYIGFVFYEKSKRYLTPERAKTLKEKLADGITAVGVFLGERPGVMAQLAEDGIIDMIQIHGSEDPETVREIKKNTKAPVIQAFRIQSGEDVLRAEKSPAEFILFDSSLGAGETMDTATLKECTRPFFLAGGLDPDNVAGYIRLAHPEVVDVSSGIETDGKKDSDKMRHFMEAVKDL